MNTSKKIVTHLFKVRGPVDRYVSKVNVEVGDLNFQKSKLLKFLSLFLCIGLAAPRPQHAALS